MGDAVTFAALDRRIASEGVALSGWGSYDGPRIVENARHIGSVVATASAISSIVGLLWTFGFLATLPRGVVDLGVLRLDTLIPLVAVSAIFSTIGIGVFLGWAGFPLSRLNYSKERRRFLDSTAPWLFLALGGLTALFFAVSASIHATTKWWMPATVLLVIPIASIAVFLIVASRKFGITRPPKWLWLHGLIASVVWIYPVYISGFLANTIVNARHENTWYWNLFYLLTFMAFATSASIFMARRFYAGTVIVSCVAVFMLLVLAPAFTFAIPFRVIGIADFDASLHIEQSQLARLAPVVALCGKSIEHHKDGYRVHVIINLAGKYVLKCGDNAWINVLHTDGWLISGGKP